MKNRPSKNSSRPDPSSTKQPEKKKSSAAKELGGQPENDEDARAAGFESATAGATRKAPIKARSLD